MRRTFTQVSEPLALLLAVVFGLAMFTGSRWTAPRFATVRRIQAGEIVGFPLFKLYKPHEGIKSGEI